MESLKTLEADISRNGMLMSRAYNHDFRKEIIDLLLEEGKLNVTDIYTHRKFRDDRGIYKDQSQVSQHLAILRGANLVTTERQGKCVFYAVNKEVLNAVQQNITALSELFSKN